MKKDWVSKKLLIDEIGELKLRLAEAEETLGALRNVDAIVGTGKEGKEVYTLKGADSVYRVLTETMNEGAVVLDSSGTVIYGNRRIADILGTRVEKIVGTSMADFIEPGDKRTFEILLKKGFSKKVTGTLNVRNPAGRIIPAQVSCNPVDIENAKICMVVTDLGDLEKFQTDLIQANANLEKKVAVRTDELKTVNTVLKESEKRYRTLFEDSHVPTLIINPSDGSIIDANRFASDFYGWTHRELTGMHISDINTLSPDEIKTEMDEALAAKKNFFKFRHRTKDGSIRDVEVYSGKMRLGENNFLYSIVLDITERLRSEKEKLESEKRFHNLFDNMLAGIAYCKMIYRDGMPVNFTYLEVNNAFEQLTGLKDVVGKKVSEVIPELPETDPGLIETFGRVALGGPPEKFETYVKALDMWFLISVYSPEKEYFNAVFDVITERKKAEAEIKRLASFPELNPISIFEIDFDGNIKYANPASLKTIKSLGLRDLNVFLSPECEELIRYARNETIRSFSCDVEIDGRFFAENMYFADDYKSLRFYIVDETERKNAELKLIESEEKYSTIVETANDGIWMINAEKLTTFVNRSMAEMLGYTVEEMIGKPGYSFLDDERDNRALEMREALKKGVKKQEEFKIRRKDGSDLWVLASVAPLLDAKGRPAGTIAMLKDISKRIKAYEELRKSEERYRNTLDSMLEGCEIIDFDWKYIYINNSAAIQGRSTKEKLIGRTMMEAYPGIENTAMFSNLKDCMENRTARNIENEFTFPDGTKNWYQLSIQPVPEGVFVLSIDYTEHKRLDEVQEYLTKRNEEERMLLETVVRNIPYGVLLLRGDNLEIELVNDAYRTIAPASEFLGKSFEAVWPEVYPFLRDLFLSVLSTGEPYSATDEKLFVKRSSDDPLDEGYFTWTLVRVKLPGGDDWGVLSTIIETTERKKIENTINRQNIVLNAINRIFKEALACDSVTSLGAAILAIIGSNIGSKLGFIGEIGPDGLLHDIAFDGADPDYDTLSDNIGYEKIAGKPDFHGIFSRFITDEKSHIANYPAAFPDWLAGMPEQRGFTSILGVPLILDGKVFGMVGAANRDNGFREEDREFVEALAPTVIAALKRKKVEQALKESEQRFKLLFNSLSEGFYLSEIIYDRYGNPIDYKYIEVNPAFERIMGLSRERIIGKNAKELIPKFASMWYDFFVETATTGIPGSLSFYSENFNKYFEASAFKPNTTQFAVLVEDISKRKEAEKSIIEAKLKAEEASILRSRFVANVSHELRTPLNAILGHTHILLENKSLREKERERIEMIHSSSEHLLVIINDLMDFSKIEADKMVLGKYPFRFHDFLKNVYEIISIQPEEKKLKFNFTATTRLPVTVLGDESRIRQILLNLISNAAKFTEKGSVSLKVGVLSDSVRDDSHPYSRIRFEVSDTGIGIPNDKLEIIFESFRQLNDMSQKSKGTGLGLTISKRLVNLMGSELYVESTIGKGSRFWFDLDLEILKHEYSEMKMRSSGPKKPQPAPKEDIIVPPPQDELERLYELARIGNILEIRKYIESKESKGSDIKLFIAGLKPMSKRIDLKGIMDFVSRFTKEEP